MLFDVLISFFFLIAAMKYFTQVQCNQTNKETMALMKNIELLTENIFLM